MGNILTLHQALQPLLKRNRAHKQYSARLTRWLDRLRHFHVKVIQPEKKHTVDGQFNDDGSIKLYIEQPTSAQKSDQS